MFYNYTFLHDSIATIRRLKGCYPYAIERGARENGAGDQLRRAPKIITPADEQGENCVFETSSYATSPGHGLPVLQSLVGHPLPQDFIAFHEQFEKALVVTRTAPLHLWQEDKIIEGIQRFRESPGQPFRVFRFGDQYEREATQFGLWLEELGTMKWRVITTAAGVIDDMDDDFIDPDRIIGDSFYEWLRSWIERDGLPDLCMGLGPEGGFLDPP